MLPGATNIYSLCDTIQNELPHRSTLLETRVILRLNPVVFMFTFGGKIYNRGEITSPKWIPVFG